MGKQLVAGNAVIGQSGGPTAVINQSLVGVIEGLRGHGAIKRIFGARHGVKGMVDDKLVDLTDTPQDRLELIAATPSAALGSSRDKPDRAYCERIFEKLKARDIRYFFYIGGNDSSDTCRIVNELANGSGYELRCFHVPKTIDNDLMENDHTPGFASAARYVAMAFMGDQLDNRALPGIKINVVMGRHAGFLTAASGLMRERDDDGPHLIYVPERPFDTDAFAGEVERVYARHKRCHIAVSEGVQDKNGTPVLALVSEIKEKDAHGNVRLSGTGALGDALADFLTKKLTPAGGKPPRVRADTLGYPQRCWPDASPVDQQEARRAGRTAAEVAVRGDRDGSIAIERVSTSPYESRMKRVELSAVAAKTRHMPEAWLKGSSDVAPAYFEWLRPLVGPMPRIGWI
ncbi:MAG: 6-phosphofructokinase [Phycisphaerales bacterium]|nr:6-phosphofructokinase [Phycisphaerales bacterium]